MKHTNNRSGFTLLELLTVIAIIAILAGVLFPVFKAVKDNAKRASCITNLHDIGVGLQQYKLDNRQYPTALFARYDDPADMPPTMLEARGGLYPEYVRSLKTFTCPNASAAGRDMPTSGLSVWSGMGDTATARTVYHFEGDSYDWTDATGSGGDFATYKTVWAPTEALVDVLASSDPPADPPDMARKAQRDFARQLAWRSPDATTVVTWCMNHRGGNERALVLFLDASVDTIPMVNMTPNTVPGGGNILWRQLP